MGNCLQSEADLDITSSWKPDGPKASAVAPASPEKLHIHEPPKLQMKPVRLYGDPMCPLTMQILLALRHKGVLYECSWLKDEFKDAKLEWSARNGSKVTVPVLQDGTRKISGQPDSILQYIDTTFPQHPLVPKGELGKRVKEWSVYLRDTLSPLVSQLLYDGELPIQQELGPELDLAFSKVNSALSTFSPNGPYFFGHEFTLADILLIPVLAFMDSLSHFRRLDIAASYMSLLTYHKNMASFPVYAAARVTPESLRLYVASKLEQRAPPPLLILMLMQHRSILWHFERLVILIDELVVNLDHQSPGTLRGAGKASELNLRKLWKGYGRLVELMQEHAQMEERVIFPALEEYHEGVTEVANADHGRDLPVTNGIKEDLKGLLALSQGGSDYKEAVLALSTRLKTLQMHTEQHFQEEEKEFLPLLDSPAFGENKAEVEPFVTHCLGVMESSHKHLFPFLLAGLNPQDIYQYMMVLHRNLWETRPSLFTQMLHVIHHSDDEFRAVKKLVRERFSEFSPFRAAAAGA
ncbi:unnamed protein product [Calypogeia fissa]